MIDVCMYGVCNLLQDQPDIMHTESLSSPDHDLQGSLVYIVHAYTMSCLCCCTFCPQKPVCVCIYMYVIVHTACVCTCIFITLLKLKCTLLHASDIHLSSLYTAIELSLSLISLPYTSPPLSRLVSLCRQASSVPPSLTERSLGSPSHPCHQPPRTRHPQPSSENHVNDCGQC